MDKSFFWGIPTKIFMVDNLQNKKHFEVNLKLWKEFKYSLKYLDKIGIIVIFSYNFKLKIKSIYMCLLSFWDQRYGN